MGHIPEWMKLIDERILEYLDENGASFPFEISSDLSMTAPRNRVRRRCWVLVNAEFAVPMREKLAHERYAIKFDIADRGGDYLDGEFDASLIQPLPAPRPPHATRPGWWAGFG
ncbi:repressor phrH2 [Halorubrum cibi]|uniref:Uncharacterized protein n=1 Tax=Halorubrum cibi TaxID=413815 RepID=A0A521F3H5_9EURY|nr:repressor phrH2 [Halorubrum cibi]SMO90768.1 hypothetical protein SAMN06264867_1185 [Halorubrum cibi]